MSAGASVKISILIPVYNEQLYVAEVLRQLLGWKWPPQWNYEIIVVDDGSTDLTGAILRTYVSENKLKTVFLPKNAGKGTAVREGLKFVTGEIVIIQDADLEYTIDDYPVLLEPLLMGNAQVVYGSRFLGSISGMHWANRTFNIFMRRLVNVLFHSHITDEATAYKVFRTDLLKSLDLQSRRFEICPEMTAKILRRGIAIQEVPIRYHARNQRQGKKIRWTDAVSAVTTLLQYRFYETGKRSGS